MKQTDKHDYVDDYIEKAVKEDYDSINVDNELKEQQWNELMTALNKMNKRNKPKKLYTLFGTIAASILIFLSLSFFQTESGSAFGWLKKLFVEEDGMITRVGIVTEDENAKNSPPVVNADSNIAKYVTYPSIEDAIQNLNQKLFVPSYLPESTNLLEVRVSYYSNNKTGKIEQIYSYHNEIIKISQESNGIASANYFDNEDSLITQETPIDRDGVFINYKDEINKLMWLLDQFTFTIEANLSQDEIIKIAKSFK